jgi:hypothetical protein
MKNKTARKRKRGKEDEKHIILIIPTFCLLLFFPDLKVSKMLPEKEKGEVC